jgi:hypothetical protein
MVHRALDAPKNALGQNQNTKNFRAGDITFDTKPRAIVKVLYMAGNGPIYRYMIDGIKKMSPIEERKKKFSLNDF